MSSDQTVAGMQKQILSKAYIEINSEDRQILRELAQEVAEISARDIEKERRKLWYSHNALKETKPVIFCDPENGWNEIITQDMIKCDGKLARDWEMSLRKEIFWGKQMGDDRVVEPHFDLNYLYNESDWGMQKKQIGGKDGGSYTWEAPLKSYEGDFTKLKYPEIEVDYQATDKLVTLAKEVFGKHLTVRLKGNWWWTLGMTWTLIDLRGLEQFMLDMYDNPQGLHKLMAFLRDGHLAKLDFLEENDLLSLNNDDTYVGSGGFGYTNELPQLDDSDDKVRTMDMWGFAESQETSQVSPRMFEEFIFPYQLPILERFGLNCYGCCEPLDNRWHIIKKTPRLRRVSVSPWADLGDMAEKLEDEYIYSMKPNPADLAVSTLDEDDIRKKLRRAMEITKDCRVEIIMKDNHTLGNNSQNAIRWCQIAQEEAERVM